MKIVVVGKGGREHALAAKLKESALVSELIVCPGNAGMERMGLTCAPVETPAAIEEFCLKNHISLVVVGPEGVILSDLKARLAKHKISCFAPDPTPARLESSKLFCKEILTAAGLPTASYQVALSLNEGEAFLDVHDFSKPIVLKADGLAAGKGVWVCADEAQAREGLHTLGKQYGFPILFEECLTGPELSAFALCDGEEFVFLGTACDYKRITPNPFSANTGGMGTFSPCDFISAAEEKQINEIFTQTLKTLKDKGMPYQGFLFAGLMKTSQGLSVLEFNVRMGDPETQSLLPRIQSDLAHLILAACNHELKNQTCEFKPQAAVHVVAVSEGYPQDKMNLGHSISYSLPTLSQLYFSGVRSEKGELVNSGGRVFGVTALAPSKLAARTQAYQDLRKMSFTGMYFREDIGQ
jgi:phosphoribosylamine--glycine ligase